jgi:glycosyltransferase involved in cell wall biosynthesis
MVPMRRSTILHVGDKFGVAGSTMHGMTRLQDWWFSRFDAARFDVALCALKNPEPGTRYLEARGHKVYYLGCRRIDPRAFRRLLRLCRRLKVDLLHAHQYAASDFARLVGRYLKIPVIVHEHMSDPGIPSYQRLADRMLSSLTTEAIAVSRSTREFMIDKRSVPEGLINVIVNGAPIEEFASPDAAAVEKLREELGIPPQAAIVGAIGRVAPQKGFNFLVEAAAIVLRKYPETYFVIVGDGPDLASIRAQAAQLGIEDRIIMPGHRWDVPNLLGAFDIFAMASLFEGTPLTLLEAMSAGKAIVSTTVDGCGEVLEDGSTALLVEPRRVDQLAAGLERLIGDPALRRQLGAAAHTAAVSDLSIDRCVERMQEIYARLLAGH